MSIANIIIIIIRFFSGSWLFFYVYYQNFWQKYIIVYFEQYCEYVKYCEYYYEYHQNLLSFISILNIIMIVGISIICIMISIVSMESIMSISKGIKQTKGTKLICLWSPASCPTVRLNGLDLIRKECFVIGPPFSSMHRASNRNIENLLSRITNSKQ